MKAFPLEFMEQGFFSRLLLVYSIPSGIKYTFPPPPDLKVQNELIILLHKIREKVVGEIKLAESSMELLDSIYKNWPGLDDLRFQHYENRRFDHLLKLCLVCAASRCSPIIEKQDVIYANTVSFFYRKINAKSIRRIR